MQEPKQILEPDTPNTLNMGEGEESSEEMNDWETTHTEQSI